MGNQEKFIHFSDVDFNDRDTWEGKIILSLDIDWASDEVIEHSFAIINEYKIKCTFFVTHESPFLGTLRNSEHVELGIHPNFNILYEPNHSIENSPQIILEELKRIVPEATVSRSHSLTNSARWLNLYKNQGIDYLSNYVMFGCEDVKPFSHINGLTEVPFLYADDGYLTIKENNTLFLPELRQLLTRNDKGLSVFDFHPIHIALNTSRLDDYESTRSIHRNYEAITEYRQKNSDFGVEDILRTFLDIHAR